MCAVGNLLDQLQAFLHLSGRKDTALSERWVTDLTYALQQHIPLVCHEHIMSVSGRPPSAATDVNMQALKASS